MVIIDLNNNFYKSSKLRIQPIHICTNKFFETFIGKITTWLNVTLQDRASPVILKLIFFHDHALIIILIIITIVIYTLIRIVRKKQTRRFILEGQIIETIWTIAPADILVFIAIPSARLLCLTDEIHNPVITLKAAGHQWYWSYEYSDFTKPGVGQRLGRGIALLFHDRGTRRGWVVSSTPWPHFTPGKDPAPILQEAAWASGPVWTGGKSRPNRD